VDGFVVMVLAFVVLPALAFVVLAVVNRGHRLEPAKPVERLGARALGLEPDKGAYAGVIGGHEARLFRADGAVVLRLALPGVRWMFDANPHEGPPLGAERWPEGLSIAWGQTAPHRLGACYEVLSDLRNHGHIRGRDGVLELRGASVPSRDGALALAAMAEAALFGPGPLALVLDPKVPMDLRSRCFHSGVDDATPDELEGLLETDVAEWRFEAACRLRHAPTLLRFLRRGVLDRPERSRAVLRLPSPLPPDEVAQGVQAVARAVSMGLMSNAQDLAVWLLVRHTTAEHIELLRDLRAHLEGEADAQVGDHLRSLLQLDGVAAGQLSLADSAPGLGGLSVLNENLEPADAPRHRPRLPEG